MQVLHSFPKLCIQVDKKQKIRCQKTGSGSFFRMSYFAEYFWKKTEFV